MWDNLLGKIVTALVVPVAAGAWYLADATGIRPATKNELRDQGFYMTRQRLIDRIEDGTVTEFQRGVLSGLCRALEIKQADCEKRDQ
jgi:hypothetical protein